MVQLSEEQLNNLGREALVIIASSLQDQLGVLQSQLDTAIAQLVLCQEKVQVKNDFFHSANLINWQAFAPIVIILSGIASHIHRVIDIHSDYEFLPYYRMFQYIQKQAGMPACNRVS